MAENPKLQASIRVHRSRLSSAETKNKSRLAAFAPGENIKEIQQKLKEERENKRGHLDGRHYYILVTVADSLGLERSEVEDAILEGNQIEVMDKFLKPNGTKQLMFYYQEPEVEREHFDHGRAVVPPTKSKSTKPKVFVTDGRDTALRGICLVFTKSRSIEEGITEQNMVKELNFTMLDTNGHGSNGSGLLHAVENLMSSVFIPSLKSLKGGWGYLNTKAGHQTQEDFINSLEAFVTVLVGAKESLQEKVTLKPCTTYDLSKINSPSDYMSLANSSDGLEAIEDCMQVWIKQIEQVLAESDQMRKEADDIGPRAEVDHWKKRMSKFNYLLDQIKGQQVKAVLGVLHAAKSKLIKVWQEHDRRITDLANEAKDNVKFLYTLEKFCDPLYNSDPVGMLDGISGLVNAIRMIHSISQYYNTSGRMTSLFVKITNQMITACKSYVTIGGSETVWTQPQTEVVKKLMDCIKLNEEYQRRFLETKEKLEKMPNERPFEISSMYIFGKFDTFTKRLRKIIDMFETISLYTRLSDSKIEGIEAMANRFQVIVTQIKKKPYDFMDQRKTEFDLDYDEFRRQIQELHANIAMFMDGKFERISSTQRAILMLHKFECLDLENLGIQEKYQRILSHYARDIDMVSKIYQKNKSDPPVARDLPPIAGKISWARQLYRRIQEPMEIFQKYPKILEGPEAKKIIKNFNKLAKVLLEFEILYHRGWLRQVEAVKEGLQASLLVRHPDSGDLYVNFDPQLMTMIRETECMVRLGLEISVVAKMMRAKQEEYKDHYNALQLMLDENSRVRSKIPPAFESLMGPHIARVDNAINPGLFKLSWSSLNIDDYIQDIYDNLADLELLMDRVHDVTEFRIEAVLHDMATTTLCELPGDEPWTMQDFIDRTQTLCVKGAQTLQTKSMVVEEAANELIEMLCCSESREDLSDIEEEREDPERSEVESLPGSQRAPSGQKSRPVSSKAIAAAKKKREMQENIEDAAKRASEPLQSPQFGCTLEGDTEYA
ncbi:hypothetical protein ScPMuIL_000713 [Solemya velum]